MERKMVQFSGGIISAFLRSRDDPSAREIEAAFSDELAAASVRQADHAIPPLASSRTAKVTLEVILISMLFCVIASSSSNEVPGG